MALEFEEICFFIPPFYQHFPVRGKEKVRERCSRGRWPPGPREGPHGEQLPGLASPGDNLWHDRQREIVPVAALVADDKIVSIQRQDRVIGEVTKGSHDRSRGA